MVFILLKVGTLYNISRNTCKKVALKKYFEYYNILNDKMEAVRGCRWMFFS